MKKKFLRIGILSLAVVLILGFGISFSSEEAAGFNDLGKDHWAYESIMEMHKSGIIAGYPDGSFRPEREVNYGEFIKMVAVATKATRQKEESRGKHWALPFYYGCLNNFFFTEWDIKEKQLDYSIPRKDMALIVSGAIGVSVKLSEYGDYTEILAGIIDINQKHPREYHIAKAYATGVLSGYPDGTFRPEGVLTRAEASSVIRKLTELLEPAQKALPENMPEKESTSGSDDTTEKAKIPSVFADDIYDLVAIRENPHGFPDTTVEYILFDFSNGTEERMQELERILKERHPDFGKNLFNDFKTFVTKPIPSSGLIFRKQYIGLVPVLMNHSEKNAVLTLLPVGYKDPYWNLKPGQFAEYTD